MINLVAASIFFLGIHLLIAGTSLRTRVVSVTGEGAYLGLFSLISLGGIAWLSMAYDAAQLSANPVYWVAPAGLMHAAPLVMLLAFVLMIVGLTTPNPTAVKAEGLLDKPDTIKGILRITRHPFLWSAILWAALHLAMNGDLASILFFGTFLVLAAMGTGSIDAKKRRALGEKWADFAKQTSNIPFAAIITGRNHLALGEIGLWRILLGVVVFGGAFYGHLWLFGVAPVPGWAPY
tara:strand:- start:86596 stop:87300 length:705 start_codon:yes stop_codon:yes gene_type:complete